MLSISVKGVSSELAKVKQAYHKKEKEIIQRACEDALEDLRTATPVDTGRAKSSWRLVEASNKFKIENDVPYMLYLNEGSSKQAPRYFIERIILKYGRPKGAIVLYKE